MLSKSIPTATNTGLQKITFYCNLLKRSRCLYSGSDLLFHQYTNTAFHCNSNSNSSYRTWAREQPFTYISYSTLCKQYKDSKHIIISSNLSSHRKQHSHPEKESGENVTSKKYDSLYVLQHIRLFRIIGYLAKISTVITSIGCPLSLYLYFSGSPTAAANIATALAINTFLFLVPCITFTSRVVCKIMLSEDNKSLKISHMSVFGRRKDIYVHPQDLIVDSDPKKRLKLFMRKVKFQNAKKTLLFFPGAGDEYTEFQTLEALFNRDETLKK